MTRRPILPLEICEFICDDQLLRETRAQIESLNWIDNRLNFKSREALNTLPQFGRLHQWFSDCIEETRRELELPFERLVLTQSWANRATRGQSHHRHTHPNSFMSGLFYLTGEEGGKTQFFQFDRWFNFFLITIENDEDHRLVHSELPTAGKLLLFPSTLEHCVEQHAKDEPRFTISFNVFPEGRFNDRPGNLAFLNLKIIPYEAQT